MNDEHKVCNAASIRQSRYNFEGTMFLIVSVFLAGWYLSGWVFIHGFWWVIWGLINPLYPFYKSIEALINYLGKLC